MECPRFQGSLEKQGKIAKSWKKYWFVLKEGQLSYVRNQDKANKQGHIDICQAQSVRSVSGSHGWPFEIVTRSRTHNLSSETSSQRDKWLNVLQESMSWHSRRKLSRSTESSLVRASCNSIEDEDLPDFTPGSPTRSSGYGSGSSGTGNNDTCRESSASQIMYTNPDYGRTSLLKTKSTSRQDSDLYEEIDAATNPEHRQSRHNELRRLHAGPTKSLLRQASNYSNTSGIYSEVHESAPIAISHIVKGYANVGIAVNKGPQTVSTSSDRTSSVTDDEHDYDDVFVDRNSNVKSVRVSDAPRPDYHVSNFPPIPNLPHARIELMEVNAFTQMRSFLANNRGPREVYSAIKEVELNGMAIARIKNFLCNNP